MATNVYRGMIITFDECPTIGSFDGVVVRVRENLNSFDVAVENLNGVVIITFAIDGSLWDTSATYKLEHSMYTHNSE